MKIICYESKFEHVLVVNHHVNATFMKISGMYGLECFFGLYQAVKPNENARFNRVGTINWLNPVDGTSMGKMD